MAKERELIVYLDNKPGNLANVGSALREASVNIRAVYASEQKKRSPIHLMVDNVDKAREALKAAGIEFDEKEVFTTEIDNLPGTLGDIAKKLAAKNINIDYAYFTTLGGQERAFVVLGVPDANAVEGLL